MSGFSLSGLFRKNKQGATLAVLLGISTLSILLSGKSLIQSPVQVGIAFVSIFQNIFTGIGDTVSGTLNSIHELGELQKKYDDMASRLERYHGLERTLVELRQENKLLRDQLQFQERSTVKLIPAQILSSDPSNVTKVLLINKGFLDGVRKDAPVIAYQGDDYGLVGRVIDAGFTGAQVQTITDSGNFVAARFLNNRYEGIAVGQGGASDNVMLQFVRKRAREEIRFGDIVVTSGNNSLYPRGIGIGRVSQIYSRDYETTLEIELEPVVNFSKLEFVFIVVSEGANP